jgi:purine-binding chemotaxis protein CheW
MSSIGKLVLFHIEKQQFALPLDIVDRIVNIVEICPLPNAPDHIAGTINYRGELLPVVNLRKLFLIPEREVELSDQLIITNTTEMTIALWVDKSDEIVEMEELKITSPNKVYLENEIVNGLFNLYNNRILISDPNKFLTPEQIAKLRNLLMKKEITE